jgi:hypothetical protein
MQPGCAPVLDLPGSIVNDFEAIAWSLPHLGQRFTWSG